jgi:NAD(P)H-dependent FMN reductase
MKKVLFLIGSTRAQSTNRQLAEATEALIKEKVEVSWLDFSDIPFFNQDIEFPVPECVARIRAKVKEADALWFFTPEYNTNIPGYLKNTVDWLSRPIAEGSAESVMRGKPALISGIGGAGATMGSRKALSEVLRFMGMNISQDANIGYILTPEEYKTSVLNLTDTEKDMLQAQVSQALVFLGV